MAEKTMNLPRIPSALRRAKEAAEQEAQTPTTSNPSNPSNPSNYSNPSNPEQGRGEAAQPQTYQFSGFAEKEKSKRVTRTFTMEPETEAKLEQAARKYGVSKSAILERAFLDWFELVNG